MCEASIGHINTKPHLALVMLTTLKPFDSLWEDFCNLLALRPVEAVTPPPPPLSPSPSLSLWGFPLQLTDMDFPGTLISFFLNSQVLKSATAHALFWGDFNECYIDSSLH